MSGIALTPNDGLGDLEGGDSPQELLNQEDSGANPLLAAARAQRDDTQAIPGKAEGPAGDDTDDDQAAGDEPADELDSGDDAADTEESDATDEADQDDDDTAGNEPALFDVSIPVIGREDDDSSGRLVLEGVPQEFHDQITAHLKRSARAGNLETELQGARQHQATAEFLTAQPLASMLMISTPKEDNGIGFLPADQALEVGQRYVTIWARQHPAEARKVLAEIPDETDGQLATLTAKDAQRDAADTVSQAFRQTQATTITKQFVDDGLRAMNTVAAEMALDADDADDFREVASTRLHKLYKQRVRAGKDPRMTQAEMIGALESVSRRFTTPTRAAAKGTSKDGVEKKSQRFRTVEQTRQRTARLKGGVDSSSSASPMSIKKIREKVKGDLTAVGKLVRAGQK